MLPLFTLVKEKEDAHTDPEFQPMKDDDCTFGEYRWEKVLRSLEPPESILPINPCPIPAFRPDLLSLAGALHSSLFSTLTADQ